MAGIAGAANATISNCINNGEVRGNVAAGIVSYVYSNSKNMKIEKNVNNGNIKGKTASVGITHTNHGNVTYCENKGEITLYNPPESATYYLAGITAFNRGEVNKCKNEGKINAIVTHKNGQILAIGGISSNNAGTIDSCYNLGEIYGENDSIDEVANTINIIGGIAATNTAYQDLYNNGKIIGIISNCYNTGKITSIKAGGENSSNAAGICAGNTTVIKNCYNIGALVAQHNTHPTYARNGGIIGYCEDGKYYTNGGMAENCYYLNSVAESGCPANSNTDKSVVISAVSKTSSDMQKDEFVTLLNSGNETSKWKIVNSENNGYPILSWQD